MYSILKTTFQKEEPKILIYHYFKKFIQIYTYTDFQSELVNKPNSHNPYEFEKSFVEVLDTHAPKKRKILRGNYKPHVNKTLHSAIIKCSQLKIEAMKSKSKNDVIEYKKQRNLILKLEKCCKNGFFDNLETKITLKRFGQLLSHISPRNMQRVM